MRKRLDVIRIHLVLFLTLLVYCTCSIDAAVITLHTKHQDPILLNSETVEIRPENREKDFLTIECQGTEYLSETGQPNIPWQIYRVLLPPNVDLGTVFCLAENLTFDEAGSSGVLEPVPPMATWDAHGNPILIWPEDRIFVDGKDIEIYNTDAFWPSVAVKLMSKGKLRQWNLAEIAIPLVRYNPVSGRLMELTSADIHVQYDKKAKKGQFNQFRSFKGAGRKRVKSLVTNFADAAGEYNSQVESGFSLEGQRAPAGDGYDPLGTTGYAIITTNWLYNNSILPSFVTQKQSRGWNVYVVTEDDYNGGTVLTGEPSFWAIRNWLIANYEGLDLQYVLLVGNSNPSTGNIPMLMYTDNRGNAPTDYYYSNLTITDTEINDGSNHDNFWEVSIGRIPYYSSLTDLNNILQKTIDYENATDVDWRNHVLLPMVPLDSSTPAFQCGEQIKYNLLELKGIHSFRVYNETYGTWTPPEYLKSQKKGWEIWRDETIGLIAWETHGNQTSASGIINTSNVSSLNDNYPTATFQMSCQNAWPENSNNLAYRILKNGGITTVAGTRNLFYNPGKTNYTGDHIYKYAMYVTEGQTCGIAKDDILMSGYEPTRKRTTLYGDPSIIVYPSLPALTVTPTDTYSLNKAVGRTFTQRTYTLLNNTDISMNWTAAENVNWLDLSQASGTIAAGGSTTVTASVNAQGDALTQGTHTAQITFSDTTNGVSTQRIFELKINLEGMLAHWQMDETAGLVAPDSTGNGLDGVMVNMSESSWIPSFSGNALYFDGSDDFVRIEKDSNLNSDSVTITAWIKRDGSQTGNAGIVFNRYYGNASGLNFSGSNTLRYHWNSDSGTWDWESGLSVPNNQWTPVALVVEPDKATMYINDGQIRSAVHTYTHTPAAWEGEADKNAFVIGRDPTGSRYYKGVIDDVRIYNYAATAAEVEAIWDDGMPDVTPPTPDPMSWASPPTGHTQTSIQMTATTASDPSGVEYYFECTAGGGHDSDWQTSPVYTDIGLLPETQYTYRVKARDVSINRNETGYSSQMSAFTLQEQWPYIGIFELPCRIEAEDYDEGGQSFAYYDSTSGNSGLQYRSDDVDIQLAADTDGGYAVWTGNSEWLEYTMAIPTSGYYVVDMRLASAFSGRTIQFIIDEQLIQTVDVPSTGGMSNWQTITLDTLHLDANPEGVMRIEFPIGGFNFNWVKFRYLSNQWPYSGSPAMAPCRIEAEDYDLGGEGAAYHDTTAGNSGLEYRQDDVDIQTSCDVGGGYHVWAGTDEWLEYTLGNVEGTYAVDFRISCAFSGKTIEVYLDDLVIDTIQLPNTGDQTVWKTTTLNALTLTGTDNHILRAQLPQGGFSINWIELRPQTPCEIFQQQPGYIPLAGDFNADCGVGIPDLEILADSWLSPYDLDDLEDLSGNWLLEQ